MKRLFTILFVPTCLAMVLGLSPAQEKAPPRGDGFELIFDGLSLAGWHVSAQSGHSKASGNRSGGKWVVQDAVIVGSQDVPGNGGLILTDKQYGDFEIVLEMNNDFVPDSGLFLRSNDKGQAYQAMIDYHEGGNLMGVYGEGLTGGIEVRNFTFGKSATEIKELDAPLKLPVPPELWPDFWRHGEWSTLRARITGNPPTITTWIRGVKFTEWTDPEKRHADKGSIGLQIHGGGDLTKHFVRYRAVRVKELRSK